MVCVRGRGSPCAILLRWFSMAASSPYLTRPAPLHLLSLTLNSNRFPFSPVPKNKMLHEACGADLKDKSSCSGRVKYVSSPPVDGQSPSSFVVESSLLPAQSPPRKPRLRRRVARGCAGLYYYDTRVAPEKRKTELYADKRQDTNKYLVILKNVACLREHRENELCLSASFFLCPTRCLSASRENNEVKTSYVYRDLPGDDIRITRVSCNLSKNGVRTPWSLLQ